MTSAMREVLSDGYLGNWVGYYAYKIARRFPNTMDREDAEQELWEAIVKAMDAYDGSVSVSDHARSAAYSKYGHMIDGRLRKLPFHEKKDSRDFEETAVNISARVNDFEKVEHNNALDRIEELLQRESEKATTYTLALRYLRLRRKGFTVEETARELHVDRNRLDKMKSRVFSEPDVRNLAF